MNELTPPQIVLAEIETLQDEVLRRLDELNLRIERTLAEFGGTDEQPSVQAAPTIIAPPRQRRRAA